MTSERFVRMIAGLFVVLSLALGVHGSPVFHGAQWLWLAAFVGVNLFQSSLTGFCPAEIIVRKLGARSAADLAK